MKLNLNLSPSIMFGSDELPAGSATSRSISQRSDVVTTPLAGSRHQREAEIELRSLLNRIVYDDEYPVASLLPKLERLLDAYGVTLVDSLRQIIDDRSVAASWKLGELLALLGQVAHASTRDARRYVLISSLFDPRVSVRDGAISGLASLYHRDDVKHLQFALQRETREELKISLAKLISWLQG